MANSTFLYGLKAIGDARHMGFGGIKAYFLPSSAGTVGIGDIVVKLQGLNANPILGYPKNTIPVCKPLTAAAGTNAVTGVVVGIQVVNPYDSMGDQGKTGHDRIVLVQDSIDAQFKIRANAGKTIVVGQNADIVYAAPDAATGVSQVSLAASAATATLPLKIVGVVESEENDAGAVSAEYIVRINNSTELAGTAGVAAS